MKVSIIVTCYNQERYITNTIKSINAQTYKDWECIIIDDGSTDRSRQCIEVFLKSDSRFRYIYQNNQGVCWARNRGAEVANGEYILFVDGDDLISPEYVSLCVDKLDADKNVKVVASNYRKFGLYRKNFVLEPYSIGKLMGHNLFVITSMFRKTDFERTGGFTTTMDKGLEDWDFWLSLLEDGGDVAYLEGFHFFYRIRSGARNKRMRDEKELELVRQQLWANHKDLYSKMYSSPVESEEYIRVSNSLEYRIGRFIFAPFRFIINQIL